MRFPIRRLPILIAFALLTLAAGFATAAEPKTAPPLRDILKAKGYVEIPLSWEGANLFFDMTLGGEKVRACLDTGAFCTSLDPKLAAKLKLQLSDTLVKVVGIDGVRPTRSARLEDWRLGELCGPTLVVHVEEKSALFEATTRFQILVGNDILRTFSAVIDLDKPAMYLISPVEKETRLQGEWQAISATAEGRSFDDGVVKNTAMQINGDALAFSTDGNTSKYRLVVGRLTDKPVKMNWIPLRGAKEGKGAGTAVYRFDTDDTLTIALRGPSSKKGEFPTEFKSTKENGYTVITFKRVKAETPKK